MKFGRSISAIFLSIIICCMVWEYYSLDNIQTMAGIDRKVIMLDSGHGGWDPGKTGVGGSDEKHINLEIANYLQGFLEEGGAIVIISRNSDEALGKTKKIDMNERRAIADESKADILISIHQNAFPQISAKGAQVFYYNGSVEGELLAKKIQDRLVKEVDPNNKRVAKANTDYYILKKMEMPAAIVECGFISNPQEEQLLNDPEYRKKVAWAIYLGIVDYFNGDSK